MPAYQSKISAAIFAVTLVVGSLSASKTSGIEPAADAKDLDLTKQINHLIQQQWENASLQPAARCSDQEFARRVYLDLAGRIPTVDELNDFLTKRLEARRTVLVDELLASEDHAQHFADIFDTLLMGRAAEHKYQQRISSGWRSYLENVFRANRPWNDVAAEILRARPEKQKNRGAVWFLYERNNEHQAIAEAVAPAFFGVRIECAQCHDHMIVNEITQAHYWGMVAFFNRGKNVKSKHGLQIAESAVGGFSEFANLEGDSTPNFLTFLGADTVKEPRPQGSDKQKDSDDLYVQASVKNAPRVPKFSRRERFVEDILRNHPLLASAMVNRLWAIMLGRGIVHPFDEMDSVHQPSHPELLALLSNSFRNSGYDIRAILRSITLCDAYHLDSRRPERLNDPASFAWYLERPLTGEQLARSIQLAARGGFKNDADLLKRFRQQMTDVLPDETVVNIDDTLFLANNEKLDDFLAHSFEDGDLLWKALKLNSHANRVRSLFETVYSREPSKEETSAVVAYLDKRNHSPKQALQQVLWSLLTSAEFQFNH